MEKVKLGQLTNIKTGRLDVNAENPNGKYPFFTCSKNHTYIDEYAFDGESVLVAGNGDLNVKYYNGKFNAYQRTYVIQANENLNGKFLYYFLDSYVEKLREQSIGGVIKYIKLGNLTDAEIPLPPLATQQRIAAILDQADALIQNNRAIVQKYDALTQSLFLDMFGDPVKNEKGWEKVKGSLIYQVKGRVGWKGYKKTDLRESGAYVIGATHIDKFGYINLTNPVYISDEKFLESPEIIIEKNDLIFVQRGNTIGKIGLVRDVLERATINPVVVILRPKVSPYFLLYLLLNKSILNKIIEINSGSAQPMITQNSMNEYQFINPPLELQNQFAERVAMIEAQKQQAQLELAKSEELFNSLLQRAFKGELN